SGNTSSGAVEGNHGGGIYVGGSATLTDVTVSGNTVTAGWGGGIDINGTATLTGVTVSGNTASEGGGINVGGTGAATITGGTVSGNTANAGLAGGIIVNSGGTATLTGVTVSGNFGGNSAGGIYVGGAVTLTGVTVSGNTAGDGGGIYLHPIGSLTMRNSTVSGNSGGGLFTNGDALIEFSTITNNTSATDGAGLTAAIGTVDLFASIIALNNGDECATPDGFINSLGSNLSSDATCELDQPSDRPSVANPMLGTLASNGGSTQTHALLAGSPAIDAVQLVGQQLCLGTDQRGISRPQDGDRNGTLVCDIGAYELIPVTASITDVSVIEGNSGTVDAVFTVTLSRASTGTVSFAFATANGTATGPSDYQAATGTVTFAPGDTSETITVRVVGDTVDEPNETFVVDLSAPVGAAIADGQGTGTILDDEGPIVTPAPAAGQLPDTGTTGADRLDGSMPLGLAIAGLVGAALAFLAVRSTMSRTTR
ncbi:MAG: choice-of-anchor Q domain-containing protein, partial [Chloroflexota bacterium]